MDQSALEMRRFLIEVNGDGSYYDPMRQTFFLNQGELADFCSLMKDLELIDDFNKNIIISCELCNSSIISADYFYLFIRKVFDTVSKSRLLAEKYAGMDMLYNALAVICSHLVKSCALNATGLPGNPDREGKEGIDDADGNAKGFAYAELGIILNPNCSCHQIIARG